MHCFSMICLVAWSLCCSSFKFAGGLPVPQVKTYSARTFFIQAELAAFVIDVWLGIFSVCATGFTFFHLRRPFAVYGLI